MMKHVVFGMALVGVSGLALASPLRWDEASGRQAREFETVGESARGVGVSTPSAVAAPLTSRVYDDADPSVGERDATGSASDRSTTTPRTGAFARDGGIRRSHPRTRIVLFPDASLAQIPGTVAVMSIVGFVFFRVIRIKKA